MVDELLAAGGLELEAEARHRRAARAGRRITYSPKVFVPLTRLCRDRCGYCTFAAPPARLEAPFLTLDKVVALARAGAAAGCHEALFTLGEAPEQRWEVAARWLADRGYASTVDYLVAACAAVLAETGLLPHANAGALGSDDLARLREVAPSQGMMLESLDPDLACHRGAPDKAPERRLATLEAAGRLQVPFTTGVLVGIGESRASRLKALRAIAASHARHGHVQEVIVQNFLPKPGTAMHGAPPCPPAELAWTVAAARVVLPLDVAVQAPPNLSDDLGALLAAGVDDWGGVSPVTPDHVNPERHWPHLDRLAAVTEAAGHVLAPRLTVHPAFVADAARWLDPGLAFAVADRADAEGLARDDRWAAGGTAPVPPVVPPAGVPPASVPPPVVPPAGVAGPAAPAGPTPPGPPGSGPRPGTDPVARALEVARDGGVLDEGALVALFSARGSQVLEVAAAADELRQRLVGPEVTWVANRNINYTNVCTFKCRFCAFSKGPLSLDLRGAPYLLDLEEIQARVVEAAGAGATEVCLQGGIHPDFDGDYYLDVCRAVAEAAPGIHIHGFTALEVTEGARRLGQPLAHYLERLVDAGLRSLPGTAAEILDDEVRAVICPDKVTTAEWLAAHRTAHAVGLRSNITIMFGTVEHPRHWARHLVRTRELQAETGGFTEFVPLPFVHMAAPLYRQRRCRPGPTFREVVLVHAVARLAYGALVPNVQASWVKVGAEGCRQVLAAGVNDLGGTLMDENISRAAGASHGQRLTAEDFAAIVAGSGRPLRQRTTLYGRVEEGAASVAR